MPTTQGPLIDLLPEIYPIIAAHLPLYATPSTLLALALTNHRIAESALPLVYSRVVLRNEGAALLVLQKLVDNLSLGSIIRELHVMSDLSLETRIHDPPSDVLRRLVGIISMGYLPFIHTLGVHLSHRWYYDDQKDFEPVMGFGRLGKGFGSQLKEKCPRLRVLKISGFMEDQDEPWIEDSGLLQVSGITDFSIHLASRTLQPSASHKLFQHISSLALSLQTLDLKKSCTEFESITPILKLDFPHLRSLSFASFSDVNTLQAMDFWGRHPTIVYLNITSNVLDGKDRWFSSALPDNFLPNLLHLRVRWAEALLLAPILGQLLSLSIHKSVNAQIPYLFRAVCPNGLPKLRSLDIGQSPSSSAKNKSIEGSLWYESEDGTFQRTTNKGSRTVFESFMHSIVHAAPNLEEIGFHGVGFPLSDLNKITNDLNRFTRLKRLCYREKYFEENETVSLQDKRNAFASQARNLAEAVPSLASITDVAIMMLRQPYMTARIGRGEDNHVSSVTVGDGCGMTIGYENEAFPWAPHEIV